MPRICFVFTISFATALWILYDFPGIQYLFREFTSDPLSIWRINYLLTFFLFFSVNPLSLLEIHCEYWFRLRDVSDSDTYSIHKLFRVVRRRNKSFSTLRDDYISESDNLIQMILYDITLLWATWVIFRIITW